MFITRGEMSLSLDSIESFRCLNTGYDSTPFNGCTEYIKEKVRFEYRRDKDERDLAYRLLVDKFSLEL